MFEPGNQAPQLRPGAYTPLPPYQHASPAPAPPLLQAPHGSQPPGVAYQGSAHPPPHWAPIGPPHAFNQQASLAPPPLASFTSSVPHNLHPPLAAPGCPLMFPPNLQSGSSYTPIPSQNVHGAMQPVSPTGVLLPPPAALPSSQGQVLYRPPHLPPAIQHVPIPPLLPQSGFIPICPPNSLSYVRSSVGDTNPLSIPLPLLPPPPTSPPPPPPASPTPPPPPSSPPPLPPSPPSMSLPKAEVLSTVSGAQHMASVDKPLENGTDGLVVVASQADNLIVQKGSSHQEHGNFKKDHSLVDGEGSDGEKRIHPMQAEESRGLPSTLPRVIDKELQKDVDEEAISPADSDMDMEDLTPVRALPNTVESDLDKNVLPSFGSVNEDSNQMVKLSPAPAGTELVDPQKVYVGGGSPFRFIKDYASEESSEDDKGEFSVHATHVRVDSAAAVGFSNFHQASPREGGYFDHTAKISTAPTVMHLTSDVIKKTIDQGLGQQVDENVSERSETTCPSLKDASVYGNSVGMNPQVRKHNSEEVGKQDDSRMEVDEFGRLMRKGASDSDSDGMQYTERWDNRNRNRSHNRSPEYSRWRQRSRSPRRDKQRLSGRSRSKSPLATRWTNGFARRGKNQTAECFNFIRGKCFRGASCRFLHLGFTRDMRRMQQFENISQEARNYNVHSTPREKAKGSKAEGCQKQSSASVNAVKYRTLEAKLRQIKDTDDMQSTKNNEVVPSYATEKRSLNEAISEVQEPHIVQEPQKRPIDNVKEQGGNQSAFQSFQSEEDDGLLNQPAPDGRTQSLPTETSGPFYGELPASCAFLASADNTSEDLQNAPQFSHEDGHISPHAADGSVESTAFQIRSHDSQPDMIHASPLRANQNPANEPDPTLAPANKRYAQSLASNDVPESSFPALNIHMQSQQLLPACQQYTAVAQQQDNLVPPATSFQSHRPPKDMFFSHGPLVASNYYALTVSRNPAWSNLPPPPLSQAHGFPPRPGLPVEVQSLHMQPNILVRNDFTPQPPVRPDPPGEPTQPGGIGHHQSFYLADSSRHLQPLINEARRSHSLTVGQSQNQLVLREESFSNSSVATAPQSNSNSQRGSHMGDQPFPDEEDRRMFHGQGFPLSSSSSQVDIIYHQAQSFSGDHAPTRVPVKEKFLNPIRNLPYSHYQPPYNEHNPASASLPSKFDNSFPRYQSSFHEKILPPHLPDPLIPRIPLSTHHNPFASTFERPTSSFIFGSNASMREGDRNHDSRYGLPVTSGNLLVGRVESTVYLHGCESSAEVVPGEKQIVRERAVGDAYDPLFDSIEPSSSRSNMIKHEQNPVLDKSSCLREPADVEENNRKKGVLAATVKSDDELDEVATDADGGDVENISPQYERDWSPGIPDGVGNAAAGEIEINQVESAGKSKKSKDSRSMRLFKIALAKFAKEILKPSWRQGNMSKEAFKTVVKKTVDKVSGAMVNRRIPKSQAKIDHYVQTSHRKLTKLVKGYADKYAKM